MTLLDPGPFIGDTELMTSTARSMAKEGSMKTSGETRGKLPNVKLRRQIVRLRRLGLSVSLIAKRLECSRQNVYQVMKYAGLRAESPALCCQECRAEILNFSNRDGKSSPRRYDAAVLCLNCLAKHPEATLGQRIKAHRLAAGWTLGELSKRTGISQVRLCVFERGGAEPMWRSLVKLLRVFGVGLVDVCGKSPEKPPIVE
jgi:DNA-binding XRE family transcriptional regulator